MDRNNKTNMSTPFKVNPGKERVTALWKGQSTLATLTTNPLQTSVNRVSIMQHQTQSDLKNYNSEEQLYGEEDQRETPAIKTPSEDPNMR